MMDTAIINEIRAIEARGRKPVKIVMCLKDLDALADKYGKVAKEGERAEFYGVPIEIDTHLPSGYYSIEWHK